MRAALRRLLDRLCGRADVWPDYDSDEWVAVVRALRSADVDFPRAS